MPLYEYQCEACGHRFERIQKFSDPAVSACPVCAGSVRKLISSPAIQFKGSGFYITDYAKPGAGKDAEAGGKSGGATPGEKTAAAESKAGGDSPATDATKSETKSETKSTDSAKPADGGVKAS
jgi:putative FmdB family regulatory protein